MQATSDLHKSIFSNFESCQMQYKAVINGVEYAQDVIENISTPVELYPASGSAVGRCVSRELDMTFWMSEGVSVPRAAEVRMFVRLARVDGAGAVVEAAEWLPKGIFFIDTRTPDTFSEQLTVHGYDALYKANKPYRQDGDAGEWPRLMADVVTEIATRLGVTVDARTVINPSYMMDYPNDLTMWEVLGYIAAAHCGNFVMTDAGELRLITYQAPGEPVCDVAQEMMDWSADDAFTPYSRVTIWWDDEHAFTAGNDTGRTLEIDCPWATQAMADGMLAVVNGYAYQPYEAVQAVLDPAVELGDAVKANGLTVVVGSIDMAFDALQMTTISAPGDRSEDHELGDYQGPTARELARKVSLGAYYYGASITREKGLQIQKTDGENVVGEALLNSDVFALRALIDGQMQDCIYFDAAEGRYRLAGNVIVDGGLTVDTLYAEQGDIAQLTVDWLDTSRKIAKYLNKDTSDDNHIKIHDKYIAFVTGVVKLDAITSEPLTEQLTNRNGASLYWQKDISGATIQDGYPFVDGAQVMTTTEQTDWPVTVYQYDEYTKRELYFDDTDAKVPLDSFGAGYGDEGVPDRGKGFIQKSVNSFDIWLLNHGGEKRGLFIGDLYTDITGLRKTKAMDFSNWANGTFSETLDGQSEALGYGVEFDSAGRPIKITDSDGHECSITW